MPTWLAKCTVESTVRAMWSVTSIFPSTFWVASAPTPSPCTVEHAEQEMMIGLNWALVSDGISIDDIANAYQAQYGIQSDEAPSPRPVASAPAASHSVNLTDEELTSQHTLADGFASQSH